MKILWLGSENDPFAQTLAPLGQLDFSLEPSSLEGYDLVATDGQKYQGDTEALLQQVLKTRTSLGLINLSQQHIDLIARETGVAPAQNVNGVLLAGLNAEGKKINQVRFLPQYDEAVLAAAQKGGLDPEKLITGFIQIGIKAHFNALAGPNSGLNPPTNNLVPNYSQSPFSVVQIPPKALNFPVNGMYNLSTLSMTVSAQLYCYRENKFNNNDFVVIAVAQMNNIPYGNSLMYSKTDAPSCSVCVTSYYWWQFFQYAVSINALDTNGNPIVNGVTVYNSSPLPSTHGTDTFTDSIGVPNPFTIFMDVNNGGAFQSVSFQAQYSNVNKMSAYESFDVSSLDNQSQGTAGVQFNIPDTVNSAGSPVPVQFETVSAFRFPASYISGGKFPVQFVLKFTLAINQDYQIWIACGRSAPAHTDYPTSASTVINVSTGLIDLVAVTQLQ